MTARALKKKNNMSGPFKMKGSPMARNFGISPVKEQDPSYADTVGGPPKSGDGRPKTGKTYKQAWDNMSDTQKTEHGSFASFKSAAEKYNKENA